LVVYIRFDRYSFGRGRQSEAEASSKDDRIEFMNNLTRHGVKYFSFQQESCGVGPVASRDRDDLATSRQPIRFDSGKRARAGNARSGRVSELIAGARIERSGAKRRLPFAIG
jgi:hypothetical protein